MTGPWGVLGNDSLGDCAIAAAAHAEMLWVAKYGRPLPDPTLTQVIDAYSKITGYQEGEPDTDKGADLLSVLKYWQQKGIAGQKIGAFAEVLPHDVQTLKWTIATLDLAYVGLQLPAAWKTPAANGQRASFTPTRKPWNPATWQNPYRGHCVIYTGYRGDDSFTCVSWGRIITVPMAFHKAFCDEAYAIIAPDRLYGQAEAPSQLNTKALKQTLARSRTGRRRTRASPKTCRCPAGTGGSAGRGPGAALFAAWAAGAGGAGGAGGRGAGRVAK